MSASPRKNVRELAYRLLLGTEREGRYVNLLLNTPEVRALPPDERSFLTLLLYTATERRLAYDYAIATLAGRGIDKISDEALCALRLGLCQIYDIHSVPSHAAVNETVALLQKKSLKAFVNAVLREAVRRGDAPMPLREKNYLRYLSVKYSVPQPLVRHYASLTDESRLEGLLIALTEKKPLSLTVNAKKTKRDALLSSLSAWNAKRAPVSDLGIIVDTPCAVYNLPGFDEGYFFVQDESSRLAVEALSLKRGERVADVCAAPGGKSFLAAMLVGEEGRVYSFELHESKLSLIEDGAGRLCLDNITVSSRDAREPDPSLLGTLDAVICDVPCSGLGVIGKKPDLRYRDLSNIGELPALQYEILSKSAGYLKVGGRLLYSTCTLNPEENECVTHRFTSEHPEYELTSFSLGELSAPQGSITLFPHIHNTDGFYISLIRKVR